jgi:hypothetical protein
MGYIRNITSLYCHIKFIPDVCSIVQDFVDTIRVTEESKKLLHGDAQPRSLESKLVTFVCL